MRVNVFGEGLAAAPRVAQAATRMPPEWWTLDTTGRVNTQAGPWQLLQKDDKLGVQKRQHLNQGSPKHVGAVWPGDANTCGHTMAKHISHISRLVHLGEKVHKAIDGWQQRRVPIFDDKPGTIMYQQGNAADTGAKRMSGAVSLGGRADTCWLWNPLGAHIASAPLFLTLVHRITAADAIALRLD
jgi:hypothetical protein